MKRFDAVQRDQQRELSDVETLIFGIGLFDDFEGQVIRVFHTVDPGDFDAQRKRGRIVLTGADFQDSRQRLFGHLDRTRCDLGGLSGCCLCTHDGQGIGS